MNYLWGGMLLVGIIYGVFSGNVQEITDAVLSSSKEAVTLGISMLGIVAFWSGLMETASDSGIISQLTRAIAPLMRFLFPKIPKGHKAFDSLSANFIANILGLGWAATPAGLQAMADLQELEQERKNPEYMGSSSAAGRTASDEMCVFLVMNISSLQLIPVNIIAYRAQYGSVNPAGIIVPAILATLASSIAAVIVCVVMRKFKNKTN